MRARRRAAPLALGFALALAFAFAFALTSGCGSPSSQDVLAGLPGAIYDPPRPAAPLHLSAGDRASYDLRDDRGKVVLVFFGFTRCSDVCPETMARWVRVRSALGADTTDVRFLFVSVDPAHDSPSATGAYARGFHPSFLGVAGSVAETGDVVRAWGVAPGVPLPGDDRPPTHSTQVFVVDREGMLRWGYGSSATVGDIVRGVRWLIRSDRG